MSEMKAFLLFENNGWSEQHGPVIRPECVVLAETIEEAAKKIGGKVKTVGPFDDREEMIFLPKSLFSPIKEGNDYFHAGGLLEYRKDSFYFCILPEDDMGILHFMELPLLHC